MPQAHPIVGRLELDLQNTKTGPIYWLFPVHFTSYFHFIASQQAGAIHVSCARPFLSNSTVWSAPPFRRQNQAKHVLCTGGSLTSLSPQ